MTTASFLPALGTAFLLILPAELPDKTFAATLVLATTARRLPIWAGAVAAFGIQCTIAAAAGQLLTLLPRGVVLGLSAALFAAGAALMFRGAWTAARAHEHLAGQQGAPGDAQEIRSGWRAALTSFVVLFTAEWGDLSQLLTAGLAARTGEPVAVGLGSWLALSLVAGLAVVLGSWLSKHVNVSVIRLVSGLILVVLCAVSLLELVRH